MHFVGNVEYSSQVLLWFDSYRWREGLVHLYRDDFSSRHKRNSVELCLLFNAYSNWSKAQQRVVYDHICKDASVISYVQFFSLSVYKSEKTVNQFCGGTKVLFSMRLKEIAGGQTSPFSLFFIRTGWTIIFIYLFLHSQAQKETCVVRERRLEEHSCESEGKQLTAAQMKWQFTTFECVMDV